jgi:pyruvate kinase
MPLLPLDARAGQIVATVGPASIDRGNDLVQAGATAVRLNASHMSPKDLRQTATTIRAAAPECPIVVDLQGAKMRLGDIPEMPVRTGDRVTFVVEEGHGGVLLPHPQLLRSVRRGETLSIDDATLRLRVVSITADNLVAECLSDGAIRGRKGVNVVEHPVDLFDLSPADAAHVAAMAEFENVAFAFSFMKNGAEAGWIRARAPNNQVIGKIERSEACQSLAHIGETVDVIWICRGDLGAQIGPAKLAKFVADLRPREHPVPVLMAGQVLEHLVRHAEPTRSEVCHLFDLIARGYAGIVLSAETAIGDDPVRATTTAAALVRDLCKECAPREPEFVI